MNNIDNIKKMYAGLLILFLLSASLVQINSARYTPAGGAVDSGINVGDIIFVGEGDTAANRLDFSAFANAVHGGNPATMRYMSSGSAEVLVTLDAATGIARTAIPAIPTGASQITIYPQYGDGFRDENVSCILTNPNLGRLEIQAYNTNITPSGSSPPVIPAEMDIQFLLRGNNLESAGFSGGWYDYEITLPSNQVRRYIINTSGNSVSLTGLNQAPSLSDYKMAFNFMSQSYTPVSGSGKAVFLFNPGTLSSPLRNEYSFTISENPMNISTDKTAYNRGESITVTVTGVPYMNYILNISCEDANGPYFVPTRTNSTIVYPDWSGSVLTTINTYSDTQATTYTITVCPQSNPSVKGYATFKLNGGDQSGLFTVNMEELDPGIIYSMGDSVLLQGTIQNVIDSGNSHTVYAFLKGDNLPVNGAKLESPYTQVINGNASSFTQISVLPGMFEFTYLWDTMNIGLLPGVYTIYFSSMPVDYDHLPAEERVYQEIVLEKPVMSAKFDEKTGSVFAKGDFLYSEWIASGSPGKAKNGDTNGKLRWYIFGDNFKYADRNYLFPLFGGNGGSESATGQWGFRYKREFSLNNMSEGRYYVIYQHPGYNNKFDILPEGSDTFTGRFTSLVKTSDNTIIDAQSLQTGETAYAILEALSSKTIDDFFVMDSFEIVQPKIIIDPVSVPSADDAFEYLYSNGIIRGSAFIISGRTNFAAKDKAMDNTEVGDELTFVMERVEGEGSIKDNSKYPRICGRTMLQESLDQDTKLRSYQFDPIEEDLSKLLYPGQYLLTVSCPKGKFSSSSIIDVYGEGYEGSSYNITPEYNENQLSDTKKVQKSTQSAEYDSQGSENYIYDYHATAEVPASSLPLMIVILPIFCAFIISFNRRN